ncbi:CLUMA_CG007130, isoform A [Clunio marinus]|uniref:Cytoplasmic dynein 2 light intermediate chain 1 n=1 Tax=Clunio marinus TaxID=568069 RepID=A0A1J1HZZ7_9DIPT|nr:CLUMA_CG007130, isoform A [Clunio marinus]
MVDSSETIQEIAYKLMLEQNKNEKILNGPTERTTFVLGSKGVGKTTMINNFLDRNESVKPTLALEYSFARRTNLSGQSSQKLIGNIWELGSLANSHQLIDVPIKSHGLEQFSAVIILNLSEPSELSNDLESALQGLKQSISNLYSDDEIRRFRHNIIENGSFKDHPDINTMEVMPCTTVIIGGMYDKFENLDPEVKKHVVRFLRSVSHAVGATLIFYSNKVSSLSKTARDVMNNLLFGSPQNPIRAVKTDYNEPVLISHFSDSWEKIGVMPSNSERISITFTSQIQQTKSKENKEVNDPTKDPNFREPIIDDLRAMKDEELFRLIKNSEMKVKFDSFNLANSPFNYLN